MKLNKININKKEFIPEWIHPAQCSPWSLGGANSSVHGVSVAT